MQIQNLIILNTVSKDDVDKCWEFIRDTIHSINATEYSQSQLDIWMNKKIDKESWWKMVSTHMSYITVFNNEIIGFSEMTAKGKLCCLYVHKDFQDLTIASILLNKLEEDAKKLGINNITTEIGNVAKPLFEILGYRVYQQQQVILSGIKLMKLQMIKVI